MKRAAARLFVAVGVISMITPTAAAHTAGSGAFTFEIEVLVTAAVLVLGVLIVPSIPRTPRKWFLSAAAFMAVMAFVVPAISVRPGTDASVRITAPHPGRVPAGEPIDVRATVSGGELASDASASDGGHLHVFVDGELQEMVYANATTVELDPGRHEIVVEYTDSRHLSYDPRVQDEVTVTAVE